MTKIFKDVIDMILILIIVLVIGLLVLSWTKKDSDVTQIAGFSIFMVKTGSMTTVSPIGSVVIAQRVPIASIKVGDDIVFYKNEETRVTHRVIDIAKDSKNSKDGKAKEILTTKGVNNFEADKEPLEPENIIGKVCLVMPTIGYVAATLQSQPIYLIMAVALCLLLHFLREILLEKNKNKGEEAIG